MTAPGVLLTAESIAERRLAYHPFPAGSIVKRDLHWR